MNALDTAQIKETAWEKLGGKWTNACLGFLLFIFISTIIDMPSIFFEDESVGQALYQSIWGPIVWVFTWILDLGLFAFYYDIISNRILSYKRLFLGFSKGFIYAVNVFCAQLLMCIFIVLWSLLLIIPGIMKAFSYSMTLYILIDHPEYSPLEAIKKSKELMYGHRMELCVLELRFIPWLLFGIITLGIGFIWIVPYFMAAYSEFYLQLKEKSEPNIVEAIEVEATEVEATEV